MAKPGLFDVERKQRWLGSKALVVIDPDTCPACGGELRDFTYHQPAMIRHGGYGATSAVTSSSCSRCPWILTRAVSEVRP